MSKRSVRAVVFQPDTYRGLQKGINQIANVIRPTLGPRPRVVAIELTMRRHQPPELLDEGAVIARRIVELADRDQDVGAMLVREALMHVHEQVGDGTATAAVLLQSVVNQGIRYLAAGGNAMRLRHYLEQGTRTILTELQGLTTCPHGEVQLTHIARSICYDSRLAGMLGEIFSIIGEYGRLEIRSGQGRDLEREYVEGMYWTGGVLSREMLTDVDRLRTDMENTAILASDLKIEDPEQLIPTLSVAKSAGCSSLMVIAQELSDKATALLLANSKPDEFQIAAVKAPGDTQAERGIALLDLVTLTGGRPFLASMGHQTLNGVKYEDLGHARSAWADRNHYGIVGGRGDPRALRKYIADLRAAYKSAEGIEARQRLQERIGKLLGGSAILWIGGATRSEIEVRRELAERTATAMRGAITEGVLPGGGISLLACLPALQQTLDQSTDPDQRAAYRILIKAMEEPIRTIVSNAGYDPSTVMAMIAQAGTGHGFDVESAQVVNMAETGIFDVAATIKTAVQSAVAGAALALTTDVLVHHLKPPITSPLYPSYARRARAAGRKP
jgi:chaperonin GroEL